MLGDRIPDSIRTQLGILGRMEHCVRLIVLGGIAMTGGLWVLTLTPSRTLWWVLGIGLTLLGAASIGYGIWIELDVGLPHREGI